MPPRRALPLRLPLSADVSLSELVQEIAQGLTNPCNDACTCDLLPYALDEEQTASALRSEGHSELVSLLPAVAAALSSTHHDHCASIATLDTYNR
jgi:hypothetical protein